MDKQLLMQKAERKEQLARITVPMHLTQSHFMQHEKMEGYQQDESAEGFFGCDRLMKLDSIFGTIQMGYNPEKGQSFLFANIKTSIFDTAAGEEQHVMNESRQMGERKTGNPNKAFVSRRRQDSAVVLYKAENKPWNEQSVAPHLHNTNTGALRKTLPFLSAHEDKQEQSEENENQKALQSEEHALQYKRSDAEELRIVRARRVALSHEQNDINSLIMRKESREQWFFHRVNLVFDLQKHKMFEYYRDKKASFVQQAENAAPITPKDDKDKKK
ncbi:MAG: hypothetical protein RR576_06165 [Oscillospiraceae bacterium]